MKHIGITLAWSTFPVMLIGTMAVVTAMLDNYELWGR